MIIISWQLLCPIPMSCKRLYATVCACNLHTVLLQLEFTPDSASLTPLPAHTLPPCRCNASPTHKTPSHTRPFKILSPGLCDSYPKASTTSFLRCAPLRTLHKPSVAQPPTYSVARIGMVTWNPPQAPTLSSSQQLERAFRWQSDVAYTNRV
jgi:hypothetical protein